MAHLTLTKAKSSRISKPQTKSPAKKSPSFDLKSRSERTAKPQPGSRAQAAKLQVVTNQVPAGTAFPSVSMRLLTAEDELLVSDVLAGINYLTSIRFPRFPEKGLSRHGVADLYHARKVTHPLEGAGKLTCCRPSPPSSWCHSCIQYSRRTR